MADLAASGLTPEQLALVIELSATVAAEARPSVDKAAERKRAYDREYRRKNRTTSYETDDKAAPNERDILTPTRVEKPSPNGEVKKCGRGFRLPPNWEPEPLSGKAADMVACWQAGELERELAKFKNYWLSKGANAARTDWQRTWVNWLISADERKPRNERPGEDPTTAAVRRIIGSFGTNA